MAGPAGPVGLAAAAMQISRSLRIRQAAGRWVFFAAGALLGIGLARLEPLAAFSIWSLAIISAAALHTPSRAWVAGFYVPLAALLGVDFHVATYLLEPAVTLTPALLLWTAPDLASAGGAVSREVNRRLAVPAATLLPALGAAAVVLLARDRVPALVAMRNVRATFRSAVEQILEEAPAGATIGSLTYDELGQSYADIRKRPLEERVELHKTMNPAQLDKFIHLRGRVDLKVVSVAEARRASSKRLLLAANAEEAEILGAEPDARQVFLFQRGEARTALFELAGDPPLMPGTR
jgi:hypothetical protein